MPNEFTEQMSKRTNAELLRILNVERNDFKAEAVIAAEEELVKRNLTSEQVELAKEEGETSQQFFENKANEPLRLIWKILTAIFPGVIPQLIVFGILKADGYHRKARELVRWTFYGFAFYFGVVLLIMMFT